MKKYKIIYDDQDLLVVCKFAGLAVQSARVSTPDLMSLLRNEMLERGEKKPYLGLVNRLDQPVEGIVLIGKNEKAAADLSRQVTDHIHMEKWYQTVVCGKPEQERRYTCGLFVEGQSNQYIQSGQRGNPGQQTKRTSLRGARIRWREDTSEDPSSDGAASSDPGTVVACGSAYLWRCQIWKSRWTALSVCI